MQKQRGIPDASLYGARSIRGLIEHLAEAIQYRSLDRENWAG